MTQNADKSLQFRIMTHVWTGVLGAFVGALCGVLLILVFGGLPWMIVFWGSVGFFGLLGLILGERGVKFLAYGRVFGWLLDISRW